MSKKLLTDQRISETFELEAGLKMENRVCVVCKSALKKIFTVNKYQIFECINCSHRQTFPLSSSGHVENIYCDQYFFEGGAGYPDYHREKEILEERGRKYAAILAAQGKHKGSLLDVGSAAGYMLKGFQDAGWEGTGIEPNKTMADYARKILGLNVINQSIENCKLDAQYDLVLLSQVINHLIDPDRALRDVLRCVRPQGYALVETFNYKSLTAKLMGKAWHCYIPPSVLHWFSPESLDLFFSNHGFNSVKRGRSLRKIKWAHAKAVLSHKLQEVPKGKWLVKPLDWLPDDITVLYPSEDLYYSLYRKRVS